MLKGLIILFISSNIGYCFSDANEILNKNNDYIVEKVNSWSLENPEMNKRKGDEIIESIKNVISDKNDTIEDTIISFLRKVKDVNYILDRTYVITNKIIVCYLAELLQCDNKSIANRSWNLLYREVGFNTLKENSMFIKENLKSSQYYLNDYQLLSLLELTKEEKDSILKTNIPLQFKANIGDTIAIDSIIKEYKNEKEDSRKRILADQLMETRDEKAMKAVWIEFSKPIYKIKKINNVKSCTTSTYQKQILLNMQRYFPEETLFSIEFNNLYLIRKNSSKYTEKLKGYWIQLNKFTMSKYDINITEDPPYSNLFRSCGPTIYKKR